MIQLNYRDAKPIYEQIKEALRRLVITGAVAKDEKLPSVRELASELAINPNTISRAYKELEQEGFIYTVAGRGTFINQEFDLNDSRKEELWQQFDKAVKGLLEISVSVSEMTERMDKLCDNENRTSSDSEKGGSTDDSGK